MHNIYPESDLAQWITDVWHYAAIALRSLARLAAATTSSTDIDRIHFFFSIAQTSSSQPKHSVL